MCLHRPKHHGENQRVKITQRIINVSIHVWRPNVMAQPSQMPQEKSGTRINQPKTRSLEAKECRLYTVHLSHFHSMPYDWQNSVSPHFAQNQAIHCCLRSKELSTWNHMIRSKIPANIIDAFCNAIFTWFTFPSLRLLKRTRENAENGTGRYEIKCSNLHIWLCSTFGYVSKWTTTKSMDQVHFSNEVSWIFKD